MATEVQDRPYSTSPKKLAGVILDPDFFLKLVALIVALAMVMARIERVSTQIDDLSSRIVRLERVIDNNVKPFGGQ